MFFFETDVRVHSKDHPMAVAYSRSDPLTGIRTPLYRTSLGPPDDSPGATRRAESNYTIPREEPPDHALGGSRGGVSTKIHQLVDRRGRRLAIALTPGQAGDSPMLDPLLSKLAVKRLGRCRPRIRPDALIGDKAYSSRAIRAAPQPRRPSRDPAGLSEVPPGP